MDTNIITQIRRNHGLEHATIHLLSSRFKGFGAQGNASLNGFALNLFGDISAEEVETAARDALQRMKSGEEGLALHPNCGTVLLTTAALATIAGQAAFAFERNRSGKSSLSFIDFLGTLPSAILAVVVALIVSKPAGMFFQSYTTTGRPGEMEIKSVKKISPPLIGRIFRVLLGQQNSDGLNCYFIETTQIPQASI
ncbi:MAG: DUF6391 domain-containing protein [Anaerolineae bacterium]